MLWCLRNHGESIDTRDNFLAKRNFSDPAIPASDAMSREVDALVT
jgi:hypothetical protein